MFADKDISIISLLQFSQPTGKFVHFMSAEKSMVEKCDIKNDVL